MAKAVISLGGFSTPLGMLRVRGQRSKLLVHYYVMMTASLKKTRLEFCSFMGHVRKYSIIKVSESAFRGAQSSCALAKTRVWVVKCLVLLVDYKTALLLYLLLPTPWQNWP